MSVGNNANDIQCHNKKYRKIYANARACYETSSPSTTQISVRRAIMRKAATTETVARMVSLRQSRWLASARHGAPPPTLLLLPFIQENRVTSEFLEVSDELEVAIFESTAENGVDTEKG